MVLLGALLVLASTPVLFMLVGSDFVPKDDQSEFEVAITMPEGSTLGEVSKTLLEIEAKLKTVRGVTNIFTTIGETNGRQAKAQGDVTRVTIYCRMTDLKDRKFHQRDAMADARTLLEGLGEVSVDIQIVIREQE